MTQPPRLRLVHDGSDDRSGDAPSDSSLDANDGEDDAFDNSAAPGPDRRRQSAEEAAQARARRARAWRQAVAGGIAFQALAVLHDLPRDLGYIVAGAVAPPAALALPASLVLAIAAAWLALGRARSGTRLVFLVAAAGMALAVPFWGLASPVTWPFELGGTLALAGAWLVHREREASMHLVGDPDDPAANDGSLP